MWPNFIDPRYPFSLILSTNFLVGFVVDLLVVVVDVVLVVGEVLKNCECHGFSVEVKIRDSSCRSDVAGLNFDGRDGDMLLI